MGNKSKTFSSLIMKRLAVIIALILTIIILLTSIILYTSKNSKEQSVLINVFGRQRMLTQMMAKDANRKYAIMQSLQNGPLIDTTESLKDKMLLLNGSMNKAREEFKVTLLALQSYRLQDNKTYIDFKNAQSQIGPITEKMDKAWKEFDRSISVLMNTQLVNKESAQALLYINTHNEELLNYCDEITQIMVINQKHKSDYYILFAMFLFVIFLILLIVSIFQLQKYIIVPLNELYKGISRIGGIKDKEAVSSPTKTELEPVIEEINEGFSKLNKLIELIENINQGISFDEILKYIYESFSTFIPYSHIGIALLKDDGRTLEASYGISKPTLKDLPQKLSGIKAELSSTSLENIVKNGTPRIINDLEEYTKGSTADYNETLIQAGIKASITLPLNFNNNPLGIIFFSSEEKNIYRQEHIAFLETLANSIAISFNESIFVDELLYSTVLALTKMAESRDEDTGDHLERMKQYSRVIAEYLVEDSIYIDKISAGFIKDIEKFSPMHDIGKVGIRDGILLKPGKLTAEEFEEMKKHAIYGADVLRTAEVNIAKHNRSMFNLGIEIAEGHHEKWDGSGYPYHKTGESIPLSARIVAVADVFDALTSKRPYKEAFSFDESFRMIIEGGGKHFDPNIVDAFIRHKDDIFRLYKSFHN